jgi:hypothetical protein
MENVLPWFYVIKDPKIRAAVYIRASWPRAGWRRIARELAKKWPCSYSTARRWEIEGVETLVKSVNVSLSH